MDTSKIWKLRDEIIDARIKNSDLVTDVSDRHFKGLDLKEQIDMLGNMAEAIEESVTVFGDEMDKLHGVLYCQIQAEIDPRTPAQIESDLTDAEVRQTHEYAL